jgi:hypothetical protein
MSSIFDLPAFFRRVSCSHLQRFFHPYPEFDDLDWASVSPRKIAPVLKRFAALPPVEGEAALRLFRQIDSLGNSAGTQVLIEAARGKADDIPSALSAMRSAHDRAFWICLEHPDIMGHARTLSRLASLSKRMWATRHGLPARPLTNIDTTKAELCRQITEFLQPEQFRGQHCVVEHVQRQGGVECFFAYPSDYFADVAVYDSHGNLQRTEHRPPFQMVFAYHSQSGALDIYAPGGSDMKDRLARIFAYAALEMKQDLRAPDADCFDLDVLKDRSLTFPTHPADRISLVRIQALRLQLRESAGSGFDLHVNPRNRHECIQDLAETTLRNGYSTVEMSKISSTVLQAFILTESGRDRSILFRVSMPSFCDLDDSPEEQTLRKYLPVWGIEKHAKHLASAA